MFAKTALDKNIVTFLTHIAALEAIELYISIYASRASLLATLQQDKVPIRILLEYIEYSDVFSHDLIIKLSENTDINKYAIELIERKQPSYDSIDSLGLVELGMLKFYIETRLKTGFIELSKSLSIAFILLNKKPNKSLRLCIDY